MKRAAYHHGDLPRVLVESAIEVLEERGPEGFSLREVARRADVAAAAPGHHFGNVAGLLTAVATKSFERLLSDFEKAAQKTKPGHERVVAVCMAYIDHYQSRAGMASVMFRWDLLVAEDAALTDARNALRDSLRAAVRTALPKDTPEDHIDNTATAVWTMTHGHISLKMDETQDLEAKLGFSIGSLLTGAGG